MAKNSMATRITVKASGRLHMGFFDLNGSLGRKFGSIGLSLNEPQLILSARASKELIITGHSDVSASTIAKATVVAKQLLSQLALQEAVELNVCQSLPEHAGLGSGTQLALAVGAAISHLYGLHLTTIQIAELTKRGGRSGIGIATFDSGGLIIDGGRSVKAALSVPPLLARYDFPENWAILLVFDSNQPGVHGDQERMAFNTLPVFPEDVAAELCRHVLMQAMPAVVERDLTAFGQSIKMLQSSIGDYFAPIQGGRYASQLVENVLGYLEASGVACLGQSSWGPTGFAIFENAVEAEQSVVQLRKRFSYPDLTWKICHALNRGADIQVEL